MDLRFSRLNTRGIDVHKLKYLCQTIFLRKLHSHTCKQTADWQATQNHTINSKHIHTHNVVTVMIYEHWGFEGKQINAVRMRRRSKVTSHGQWQCHYDRLCQGHNPNMLDQSLRSITLSPDRKLGHVIRTSWVIAFIQKPYQCFRLSNNLLKFRELKLTHNKPKPKIHCT